MEAGDVKCLIFTFMSTLLWLNIFFVLFLPLSLSQIQLALGPESSIAVGWKMKDVKMSAAGELKVHM